VTGSPVVDRALLVLLVVAVGLDVARLARRDALDPVDRHLSGGEALVAHLLMNLAMVVMLTPWWSAPVRTVVLVAVGALAVAFAGLLVAGLRVPALRERRPAHGYHLVAAAAMVLAVALMTDHGGHDAMEMGMSTGTAHAAPSPVVPVVAAVLAGVFALDLVATVLVVAVAPRAALVHAGVGGGPDERSRVARLRVATVPHAVMDAGMAAMLVALV
jgi:hypothetical protein